ncbi:hypothetical protein ACLVWU_07150 [Bdellovibrio sp. HCB290]|uniref:hypothetical protein n=1 Tax=Bdellovibrio sp. HCB290 TaxID=3394356 RepID=UPI0039B67A11
MKSVLAIILLYGFSSWAGPVAVSTDSTVGVVVKGGIATVSVPADARKALIQWRPEFLVFDLKDYGESVKSLVKEVNAEGTPMAFVADFNSDGVKDIVLLGSDLYQQYAVALVNVAGTWKVIEIQSWKIPNIRKIMTKNENKEKETGIPLYVIPAQEEHAKKLGKKTGIQVERFMGSAAVYEITDGKAIQVKLP